MEILVSSVAGFSLFHYLTHPASIFNRHIPTKKFWNIQLTPHINFSLKKRIIHFHHWMIFSPLYVFAQSGDRGVLSAAFIKGMLIGGIIQGLLYHDRFRIIFKDQDYVSIRKSQYNLSSLVKFWRK